MNIDGQKGNFSVINKEMKKVRINWIISKNYKDFFLVKMVRFFFQ